MRLNVCKGEAACSQRRQYSVVVPQSLVVLYLLGLLLRQPTPASWLQGGYTRLSLKT
jgi:hypothetical protein